MIRRQVIERLLRHACLFPALPESNIGIVMPTRERAASFMTELQSVYDELPDWIKPKATIYRRELCMKFDSGCRITCLVEPAHFLGKTFDSVYIDEFVNMDIKEVACSRVESPFGMAFNFKDKA